MHCFEKTGTLVCPICKERLCFNEGSLTCGGIRRHNFDIAKSGYVNLNMHPSTSGDDKEMARARQSFLRKDYYKPLADALVEAVGKGSVLCDAGCGEGYYTEAFADSFDAVLGVDLSKHALDLASKSAKQKGLSEKLLYTAASVYSLPLCDSSCDALVNVFAPCVEEEYMRVLKRGGRLVVAAAGREHLMGLKEALYDTVIPNEPRSDYPIKMSLERIVPIKYEVQIMGDDIYSLFTMTPYFYRTKKERAERLKTMEKLNTLIDFEVRVYKKGEN